jgi:hypothetical protein
VPLFELLDEKGLLAFRALHGGPELYEAEIERLVWENPDELIGKPLFPVARQPVLPGGGKPDVVALDTEARVVVIEIKRDIERRQLAQCLEYAGWARTASLDELAGMYHAGPDAFFAGWGQFTESASPVRIRRSPELVLVARDFHGRTGSALEFLVENGLPVSLIRVTMYEDTAGRRFVSVDGGHELEPAPPVPDEASSEMALIEGRRVQISDLLDAGLLTEGDLLVWLRPRLGEEYRATVTTDGALRLDDGRICSTPSRAAKEAANIPAYDGWYAWRLANGGETLHELRNRLSANEESSEQD